MTTREVAAHARRLVAEEIRRRGGRVVDYRVGQRTELRAHTRTGRVLELRVLSRRAGDWQTSIRNGDLTATTDDRYWLLVDLTQPTPGFYIVPEDWMVHDIRREHDEYLARHGGRRARTMDSLHHRIQTGRVREWRERWDLIS
jgi:hypothetical protein